MTGKTQLNKALQPLVQAAEETLQLDPAKRARTILRIDAGGGSLKDVNWLLQRGDAPPGQRLFEATSEASGTECSLLVQRSAAA